MLRLVIDAMRCDAMRCDAMRCDAMRCKKFNPLLYPRSLYKHIHSLHHQYYVPFVWVTQYAHPCELFAVTAFTFAVGAAVSCLFALLFLFLSLFLPPLPFVVLWSRLCPILSHPITCHHILSHHIPSHHIKSHHITSHHITSHHIQASLGLGCHPLSEWTWICLSIQISVEAHGGYDLPISCDKILPFLFLGGAEHHDLVRSPAVGQAGDGERKKSSKRGNFNNSHAHASARIRQHHQWPRTNFQPFFKYMDLLLGSDCKEQLTAVENAAKEE